ncbi:SOS response-associated peptidase [Labilibaculum sp. DW002]|uniref:Abasic site processing protein n=1 Tax=Paralabilibaculum antarcticum TaxID=2912572 RepID=A0ABT5VW34_9BACT|nr:SOS response-associated peptidase [Labilibaculum sp. DW002]MDE5419633.1 SOS response-associated peptidase [Labilibaculum sp. DW002]
MCYDIQAKLEAQLKRARRMNQKDVIRELETNLEPYITQWHHVSGFSHPSLLIYTNETPALPSPASWGLIPEWTKNQEQANKLRKNTINARGESIFEKPSFRDSAKHKRCLITVDGFYEHHHRAKKSFPYFIRKANGNPITLAGLWSEWLNKESGELQRTFSIVTCKANSLLAEIHNNPKLAGPRMPLILDEDEEDNWLQAINSKEDQQEIQALIRPSEEELIAYTVRPLRGKNAIGNTPKASAEYYYDELNTLF